MNITTLTIDSDDGVATTVHGDDAGAWAELRRVLVESDGEDVVPPAEDPDALLEYATTEGGLAFWIDEHPVIDQTAITVDSIIDNGIERAGVSSADLMTHGQLVALLNSVHAFVGTTH